MESTYDNPWIYNGAPLESEHVQDYVGMVYLIENTVDNRFYIGKKFFWTKKTRQKNGKKRKVKAESDWKKYYGSSNDLLADIKKHGVDAFRRTVLHLCNTKTQCAYYELKEQVDQNVLLRDESYNGFIGGKINGKNLKSL